MARTKINPISIDWDEILTGTIASGANLGLDSSNILVKASVSGGASLAGIDDQTSSNDDQLTITDSEVVINEDSDDLDFRVESNGDTHMFFVDGGNNKVGIGTSAPSQDLHISVAGTAGVRVQSSDDWAGFNVKGGSSSASAWMWQPEDSSDLRFEVGSSDRMHIDGGTGFVGLGTSTPGTQLHMTGDLTVGGDSSFTGLISGSTNLEIVGTSVLQGAVSCSGSITSAAGISGTVISGSQAATLAGLTIAGNYTMPTGDGSADQVLTTDGSGTISFASAGGGSDSFVITERGEQTATLNTSNYYYRGSHGGYQFTRTVSKTDFDTLFQAYYVYIYAGMSVIPVAADLTAYHIVGIKDGTDNDTATIKIWKLAAPSTSTGASADADTDINTITQIASMEINVNGNKLFNFSETLSSGNSFAAGDVVFQTIEATDSLMNSDHWWTISLKFEPT